MPAFLRVPETLLLLLGGIVLFALLGFTTTIGPAWAWGLGIIWAIVVFPKLARILLDSLLERSLAQARFDRALRIACATRDGALTPYAKEVAEFDVGLVHLARGAPADAVRSLSRIPVHRLRVRTRGFISIYLGLARLRSAEEERRNELATQLLATLDAATELDAEEPNLLAARAEALLACDRTTEARDALVRSLALDADPADPSPGERYVLLGRAQLALGARDEARASFERAATLSLDAPFVRAAREELDRMSHAA